MFATTSAGTGRPPKPRRTWGSGDGALWVAVGFQSQWSGVGVAMTPLQLNRALEQLHYHAHECPEGFVELKIELLAFLPAAVGTIPCSSLYAI